jgi:hypothetical protein
LSRVAAWLHQGLCRSRALARLSLCSVAMTPALSGCLDPPPEYQVPDQVPPVIMTDNLVPATSSLNRPNTEPVTFTVPFRADDAGEGLLGYFLVDIPSGKPRIQTPAVPINADPRPFAEQTDRSFSFPWTWSKTVNPGCHILTLILSHRSNFDTTNGDVDVRDPTKAAYATWFFELSDPSSAVPPCGNWPDPSTGASP